MDYHVIKLVHISAAGFSLFCFVLRCVWLERGSSLLRGRLTRVLPHVNDSILLVSAVSLAFMAGFSPFAHPWLAMKIVLLLLYIPVGAQGLKSALPAHRRRKFQFLAVLCFLGIVSLALTKPYL